MSIRAGSSSSTIPSTSSRGMPRSVAGGRRSFGRCGATAATRRPEPEALRLGAVTAQTRASKRAIVDRSGWWVITPTRVGTRARVPETRSLKLGLAAGVSDGDRPGSGASQRAQTEIAEVLVRGSDHRKRVARRPLGQSDRARFGERPRQQCLDSSDARRRQRKGPVRARATHCTARAWRIADERFSGRTALGAAREVRQVSREPQQLELERQRQRVERETRLPRRSIVEQVEKAGQRFERTHVSFLLREQPQHRLRSDQTDAETVLLLTDTAMRTDELDASHGLEIAGSLVQQQLHVRQGLEAGTEAGFRLPDSLCDRTDTPAIEGVQMQDAICLPQPERTKDDRLRPVGAAAHGVFSLVPGPARETISGRFAFQPTWPRSWSIRPVGAGTAYGQRPFCEAEASSSRRSGSTTILRSDRSCTT